MTRSPRPSTGLPSWLGSSRLVSRLRSLARGLVHRADVEDEMCEEFRHHIALRTEDLVASGLSPEEASRRAHREFGHVESHREAARASRGLHLVDQVRFSWVDVKLGLRMLKKHPGLTLVASFALAVGIPVGMAPVHLASALNAPLPEDHADRVRMIRFWDPAAVSAEAPAFREFARFRQELATFDALGAFRASAYNVDSEDDRGAPVSAAEMTASGFGVLGVRPLLGRALTPRDEAVGAPEVVVIGYDLWRNRFGGDPHLVGQTIRLGQVPHRVVGVMPKGFLFPVRQQLWVPLREPAGGAADADFAVRVFGRLKDGISQTEAQAELGAVASRRLADEPEERLRYRAEVVPFGIGAIGLPRGGLAGLPEFYLFEILALALLFVACSNVAMLVFALTATRFQELAVRSALGAGRARIVSQIFVETLVLAIGSAGVGLVTIGWLLEQARRLAVARGFDLPYWLHLGISGESIVWAILLAVLSATIAGVVPALKLTGTKIHESIKAAEAGRSGIRFGGVTGVLIVADVALAVSVTGLALALALYLWDVATPGDRVGIPAGEYLAAEVWLPASELEEPAAGAEGVDGTGTDDSAQRLDEEGIARRLGPTQRLLVERLKAEPGVRGVAVASALPRMDHRTERVEIDGESGPDGFGQAGSQGSWRVRTATVDVDYFAELDRPIVAGRGFDRSDLLRDASPVVVNTLFAERLLSGRSPVGLRMRFVSPKAGDTTPWHEIVGVVGPLGMNVLNPQGDPGVYLPAAPGGIHPFQLAIHLGGSPETFAPRLREILTEVDPAAVLGAPVVLDRVYPGDWYLMGAIVGGLGLLVVILIGLGASGLYAILSFAVSERTREIGIRAALGASRGAVVMTVLRRSALQVVAGALLGLPVAAWLLVALRSDAVAGAAAGGSSSTPLVLAALAFAVGIVAVIGAFSSVAPLRRALSIEPSSALRGES